RASSPPCATRTAGASSTATSGPRRRPASARSWAAPRSRCPARSRMPDPARLRNRYAIAGIGLSRFGKLPGTSAMGFALEESKHAIDDCGVRRDDVDGVLVAFPASQGEAHGWASRAAAFLGTTPAFCSTMDMGGATALGMLQTAVALLEAGMCNV